MMGLMIKPMYSMAWVMESVKNDKMYEGTIRKKS
jgi:hypothetical protein